MYGYVEWTDKGRRIKPGVHSIAGLRMRSVSVPRKPGTPAFAVRRRCAAAAGLLSREGITRAVFPADFPHYAIFADHGVLPTDPMELWRALAAELVQFRLEQNGLQGRGVTVAVCADRLTDRVRRTVTELCIRNRYVILCAPERDDVLCRKLRREYGVPLVQTEDPAQLADAAVTVRFSPGDDPADRGEVLELYPGGRPPDAALRLPEETEAHLPETCDRMQLLTALFAAGAVRGGQIRILAPAETETDSFSGKTG